MNLYNVPHCSTSLCCAQCIAVIVLLDVVTLYFVVISPHKATFFHSFELYELYFISVEVHKVQVRNKVHKVRTSQLCLIVFILISYTLSSLRLGDFMKKKY